MDVATIINLKQIEMLLVGAKQRVLKFSVIQYLQQGWPSKVKSPLQPYHRRQGELTIEAGCVLWGKRVVIPVACQKRVLQELHTVIQAF